jgi:hypothetical protein
VCNSKAKLAASSLPGIAETLLSHGGYEFVPGKSLTIFALLNVVTLEI